MTSLNIIHDLPIKDIYDKIAPHFNNTRQSIWNVVKKFIDSLEPSVYIIELGCGNGKNMLYRKNMNFVGMDISSAQVRICKDKGLNVEEGNITALKYHDNTFDFMICIATYHHLDNDRDRQLALHEMYRCLKSSGQILITVWAMEQDENSHFRFTKTDELVPWRSKIDGCTYLRYYHIYKKDELLDEIQRLCPQFKIVSYTWDQGNWNIILEKP